MTKLVEWLLAAGAIVALWLSLLTNKIENSWSQDHFGLLLISPVVFGGLFGLYCIVLVLYRVYTFNNCEEAAVELQKEIIEAKEDLKRLGFNFKGLSK